MRPPGSFKIARRRRLGHARPRANPAAPSCHHLPLSDEDRSQRVLESLRNEINPIRVLHDAIELIGIGATGPALPLLSNLGEADQVRVKNAAEKLLRV